MALCSPVVVKTTSLESTNEETSFDAQTFEALRARVRATGNKVNLRTYKGRLGHTRLEDWEQSALVEPLETQHKAPRAPRVWSS